MNPQNVLLPAMLELLNLKPKRQASKEGLRAELFEKLPIPGSKFKIFCAEFEQAIVLGKDLGFIYCKEDMLKLSFAYEKTRKVEASTSKEVAIEAPPQPDEGPSSGEAPLRYCHMCNEPIVNGKFYLTMHLEDNLVEDHLAFPDDEPDPFQKQTFHKTPPRMGPTRHEALLIDGTPQGLEDQRPKTQGPLAGKGGPIFVIPPRPKKVHSKAIFGAERGTDANPNS